MFAELVWCFAVWMHVGTEICLNFVSSLCLIFYNTEWCWKDVKARRKCDSKCEIRMLIWRIDENWTSVWWIIETFVISQIWLKSVLIDRQWQVVEFRHWHCFVRIRIQKWPLSFCQPIKYALTRRRDNLGQRILKTQSFSADCHFLKTNSWSNFHF